MTTKIVTFVSLFTRSLVAFAQAEVTSRTPEERAQSDFELRLKNVSDSVSNGEL